MGGTISFESKEGIGTTFLIRIRSGLTQIGRTGLKLKKNGNIYPGAPCSSDRG